jgi:uncharacterized membrane protein HdeD (DUF308 family)
MHPLSLHPLVAGATAGANSGHSNHTVNIILGIFLIAFGAFEVAKPQVAFRWSNRPNRWQFKNPDAATEPSRAGIAAERLGGIVGIVIGVVLIGVGLT